VTRLVAVSNRVTVPRRATAAGGLAVGVLAAMKSRGGLWFGWNGETTDGEPGPAVLASRQNVTFATIPLPAEDQEPYYGGFCNGSLWPLFHYFVGSMQYSDAHFAAYGRVNRLFAERLSPLLHDDDLVWVHDYHLIPLAGALRHMGLRQPLGFFLHIPFPHIEALRALPVYAEIVRDLVQYDLVGFQTARDLECFRSAVAEVLGPAALRADGSIQSGGRRTRVEVFPIGVDVDEIQRESRSSLSSETVRRMCDGLLGRRCIIGVDRLDYSKGLVDRFQAYERYMETCPDSHNRVTFLQIAPLSRADLRTYAEIRRSLEQTAGRINGRFAETDWTPIRYLNRNYSHEVLMGFLRNADVGVVTPMRDGMNLVAKEFIAAQDPDDPGVLVLSTLAGAAEELSSALLVNPRDTRGVAEAIQRALAMPLEERRARHGEQLDVLRRNDIHAWHSRFIDALQACVRPAIVEPPRLQANVR
jgi:trehalose 6-phosphate synthase